MLLSEEDFPTMDVTEFRQTSNPLDRHPILSPSIFLQTLSLESFHNHNNFRVENLANSTLDSITIVKCEPFDEDMGDTNESSFYW